MERFFNTAGLKGELAKIENVTYIVLKMEMGERNYVFTEISIQDITPLDANSH